MLILETMDLTRRFGSLTALNGVTLAVEEGEIFGLLGPKVSKSVDQEARKQVDTLNALNLYSCLLFWMH
jgi:ABC-type uncharacterized transport system ATPase subunit